MQSRTLLRLATVSAVLLPAMAWAHPGHGETSSFAAGAMHPLSGLDHLVGLFAVGVLLSRLGGRYLAHLATALLGVMVAAGTSDSDGWRFAAGFMSTSAGLIAVSMAVARAATRLRKSAPTEGGPRSPT